MLSTKDITTGGSGKIPKTLKPGNTVAKILDITLQPLKSDPEAYYLMLHLEGEEQGDDFEGFFYDKDNPAKGRAKGQVGKVRYSMYPYRNGVTKAGKPKKRDFELLRSLVEIATIMNKKDQLDMIQTTEIQDFVKQAAKILCTGEYFNWCLGGAAYVKDDGNKDFTLSLPRYDKNYKPFEPVGTTPSTVAIFNYATHVEDKTEAQAPSTAEGWGASSEASSDAGKWTPTGFDI